MDQFLDLIPQSSSNLSPLHVAAARGDEHALITLSTMGYDINEPDSTTKYTPLHLAVSKGNYAIVCCIIDYFNHTLDINLQDKHGDTSLHIAARLGNTEIVKALVDANAVIEGIQNHNRETILDLAKSHEVYQILRTGMERMELENTWKEMQLQRKQISQQSRGGSRRKSGSATSILPEINSPSKAPQTSKLAACYNEIDAALLTIRQQRNLKREAKAIKGYNPLDQSFTVGYLGNEDVSAH